MPVVDPVAGTLVVGLVLDETVVPLVPEVPLVLERDGVLLIVPINRKTKSVSYTQADDNVNG